MTDYEFILRLNKEMITKGQNVKRQIIRLTNRKEYNRIMARIHKFMHTHPRLKSIQPIPSIQSFCCSLRSYKQLLRFRGIRFIEDDLFINIHHTNGNKNQHPSSIPWGVQRIKAPECWKISTGNHIKIGIIDTGVELTHPDLRRCIAGGVNFIQRSHAPYDDNGHGTHIAGTIAASNENKGLIGVAPSASIYAVKVFDKRGSAFVSDIILGIEWCIRNKMDIINMSFGMTNRSLAMRDAICNAHRAGCILVASSGNERRQTTIDYPARYPHTIAVAATEKNRQKAPFNNKGKGIHIYAPGDQIYSTWINHSYRTLSGTSMATAHVTGAIALLLAVKPGLSVQRIKSLLKKSASPIGKNANKAASCGEVNALRLVSVKSPRLR